MKVATLESNQHPEAMNRRCVTSTPMATIVFYLLSGCATGPTATVPIPVSCVKEAPAKPATKDEAAIRAMDDYAATLTIWTERLLLKGYAEKAEAVIQACK